MDLHPHNPALRRGFRLAVATVAWNVLEGVVAVALGARAASVALMGFGIDSFIETASGAIVGWRLLEELRGRSGERLEAAERMASRGAGSLLLVLAVYIVADSTRRLLGFGAAPHESIGGIALTSVSLILMPLLGRAKLRASRELGSRALRADAYETITCAWLSLTTLAGLALNAACGWWWADPVAGLVLVPLVVREGLEARRGACCCHGGAEECPPAGSTSAALRSSHAEDAVPR